MNIYPAILSDNINQVQQQLNLVKDLKQISVVQIDIIDGFYADNMTVTPVDLVNLDFGELKVDFHLMVEEPLDYVREIIDYQDDLPVRAVLAQIERMSHQDEYLKELKKNKLKAGVSLDLPTPISALNQTILKDIDIVQLMSINAGFQGQKFDSRVFEKIKQVRAQDQLQCEIIVDGGVKFEEAEKLREAEVSGIGIGSLLWESSDILQTINQLTKHEPTNSEH